MNKTKNFVILRDKRKKEKKKSRPYPWFQISIPKPSFSFLKKDTKCRGRSPVDVIERGIIFGHGDECHS